MWYLRIFLSCLNKVLGSRQEAIPVVGQQDTEEGAVGGLELVTEDTATTRLEKLHMIAYDLIWDHMILMWEFYSHMRIIWFSLIYSYAIIWGKISHSFS